MLNRQYRGIDRTTDVLSFPQMKKSQISNLKSQICLLGDIVINLHKAERQAAEYGLTLNEELKRLLMHGLLHLTGYDHEKGRYAEKKMKDKTRYLLAKLGKN
jgi:probable rRNA maturation factor